MEYSLFIGLSWPLMRTTLWMQFDLVGLQYVKLNTEIRIAIPDLINYERLTKTVGVE